MFRNYLAAALRNLSRNRLHTVVTTLSLALGLAAMIVTVLFYRYEHGYDRFWPDDDRLYAAMTRVTTDRGYGLADGIAAPLDKAIALEASGIEATARLEAETVKVTIGPVTYQVPTTFWAEPTLFDVLKPKVLSGDVHAALADAGSAVISKSVAKTLFGDNDPIGQVLRVQMPTRPQSPDFVVRIAALIDDFPDQSHLPPALFLSGAAAQSPLDTAGNHAMTYFRVRPGIKLAGLRQDFQIITRRHLPPSGGTHSDLIPMPITAVYVRGDGLGYGARSSIKDSSTGNAALYLSLGALVLAVAAINFVTLMTARGAARAVEVGVRKAMGAQRRDLLVQFVAEAGVYGGLAFFAAVSLVELGLPLFNQLTGSRLGLSYPADLSLLATLAIGAVALGAIAGLYPAVVLSAFKPQAVLKGGRVKTPGSARLRQILVSLQFLPLVLLALGAVTLSFQLEQSARNALTMENPNNLLISETCTEGLRLRLAALPGVRSAVCVEHLSENMGLKTGDWGIGESKNGSATRTDGAVARISPALTDADGLAFGDIKLIAGRVWAGPEDVGGVVLTRTSARVLGYANPAAAIGRTLNWKLGSEPQGTPNAAVKPGAEPRQSVILGVAEDRGGFADYERPLYFMDPAASRRLVIGLKLNGGDETAILAAIDKVWKDTGAPRTIDRKFYRDWVASMRDESGQLIRVLDGVAGAGVAIAVMGLFGLASFLSEQRTKEMGVRKALGASRVQLLQMLLFQFARPVIIANIIAIPLMFLILNVLLPHTSPNDRITAGPAVYALVLLGSFALAVLATFSHAWRVTGARPVSALRYE